MSVPLKRLVIAAIQSLCSVRAYPHVAEWTESDASSTRALPPDAVDAPVPALSTSSGALTLDGASMATPAWPENASCAAGLLSREWHESTGASHTLQPNPRCANSRLLYNDHSLRRSSKGKQGPVLTLGYIYYCGGSGLAQHTSAWSAWPVRERQRLFFLIVDDGSPPGNEAASAVSADVLMRLHFAIVRIEQDIAWNIDGARNLLVAMAPTEHVLLMDMDVRVPEALAAQLHRTLVPKMIALEHASEKGHVFLHFPRVVHSKRNPPSRSAHPVTLHPLRARPAVMMLRKASYWLAGGCDEDFVGEYGVTDPHFRYRASRTKGLHMHSMINVTVPMEQASRSYSCKTPPRNATRNKLLYQAKKAKRVRWAFALQVAHCGPGAPAITCHGRRCDGGRREEHRSERRCSRKKDGGNQRHHLLCDNFRLERAGLARRRFPDTRESDLAPELRICPEPQRQAHRRHAH